MNQKEFNEILKLHYFWVADKTNGKPANFYSKKLRHIDLSGLILDEMNFSYADLRDANLRESSLINANLTGANLQSADLSDTKLKNANFTTANLKNASLFGATIEKTTFSYADLRNVDLRGILNLSECIWDDTTKLNGAKITQFYKLSEM